jgi:pimeloyl-ACP methyl ester carboxylesterase
VIRHWVWKEVKKINRRILGVAVTFILVATLVAPLTTIVQAKKLTETDMGDYTEYVGTLDHANFVVRIPDEWNGMLVVGCHAYMEPGWTPDAQFAVDNLVNGDGIGLPFVLLEQGFAYAASSYGEGGFSVKMGMTRTHQLTEYVIDNFGVTGKVFIIGHSLGGAIGLLLGEKYPELYDGVLDISAMKDIIMGYNDCVNIIATIESIPEVIWNSLPQAEKDYLLFMLSMLKQMKADMEADYGGTYDDKPQHYEKRNPASNAEISIPMITVNGALDPLMSPAQAVSFEIAVAEAGCSEYYRLYTAAGGAHGDPPTIDEALLHFEELVDYPAGW